MKQKLTIIYIPGLGDHNLNAQQKVLHLWRIYGVETEICSMNWLVDEPWSAKIQRLFDRIDFHTQEGRIISLVGVSAGSTAVLQALAAKSEHIKSAVIICPKFQYPETVHPSRYKTNPAFKTAIEATVEILPQLQNSEKRKLIVFRALWDNLLPVKEAQIPGVSVKILLAVTHMGGIAHAITLDSWRIIRFLKRPS